MRIIAGIWRGRRLLSPAGQSTRPTAERVRQALFDMLMHAAWGGDRLLRGARVLDGFAGTGALGLEALSRGAGQAVFMESSVQANVMTCGASAQASILTVDVTRPPRGTPCGLVFLDPPYHAGLGPLALAALDQAGWIAPAAVVVLETDRSESLPELGSLLARRDHGVATISIWRIGSAAAE
jgi:16S rRNA (guanine966-N2)-methyltransferase